MAANETVTVTVQLTFADIVHADRLFRASTARDFLGPILAGAILLVLGVCGLGFFFINPHPNDSNINVSWITWLFLILAGLAYLLGWLRTAVLWIGYRSRRDQYSETFELTVEAGGVHAQQQNVDTNFRWDFFTAGLEGRKEFLLVHRRSRQYYLVPKSAFANETQMDLFRDILKSHMPTFKQNFKVLLDFQK